MTLKHEASITADEAGRNDDTRALSTGAAADELLKRWGVDDESLSDDDDGQEREEGDSDSADDPEKHSAEEAQYGDSPQDPEDVENGDDAGKKEAPEAPDNAVVKITVDGKELRVSVKELTRLYGQETALTRKSQEVAEVRKAAEAEQAKYTEGLKHLVSKAQARFKPYADIDMLVASKTLSSGDFVQLRKEAKEAFEDFKFLAEELDGHMTKQAEAGAQTRQQAAAECVKALTDTESPHRIEGWSDAVYDGLRDFAISVGVPKAAIDAETSPVVFRLLHEAKAYRDAQAKAKDAAKKITKLVKVVPKTTMKPQASQDQGEQPGRDVYARARKSGRVSDVAEAMAARWS